MQKFFLALCFFAVTTTSHAESELKRSLTLSSAYVETFFNSNEGLVAAPLSVMQASSKLFDVATDNFRDHVGKRLINFVVQIPFSYWLASALLIPFHEFGHARAMHALGFKYRYGSVSYGHHFKGLSNYWTLSGIRLITPPSPFAAQGLAYTATDGTSSDISSKLFNQKGGETGFQMMMYAGGINNQMFLAKAISTTIYENNGHPTYAASYVWNKFHGFLYTALDEKNNERAGDRISTRGDPTLIVNTYRERGIGVTYGHLKALSLLSLISGTTASLLYGQIRYLAFGDDVVRPFEIFGVRVPELNAYVNADGLSFEVETDYRINTSLTAGLSYEFIWFGKNVHEVTPRIRYDLASAVPELNEMWLKASLVVGKGIGASLRADYAPFDLDTSNFWSRFSYFVDARLFHGSTLYGERNIVSLARANIMAIDGALGLQLRY